MKYEPKPFKFLFDTGHIVFGSLHNLKLNFVSFVDGISMEVCFVN